MSVILNGSSRNLEFLDIFSEENGRLIGLVISYVETAF
jgi:hypothetical protein